MSQVHNVTPVPVHSILPGSFKTGQIQFAYRGAMAAVAGVFLLWLVGRIGPRS